MFACASELVAAGDACVGRAQTSPLTPLAPCSLRRVPEAAVRLIPASTRGPEPLMDLESMGAIICNQLGLMARLTLT